MSEDRNGPGVPAERLPSTVPSPWVWIPLAGSASLVGAALALNPWAPWSSEVPRLLLGSGMGILAGTSISLWYRGRLSDRSGPPATRSSSVPGEPIARTADPWGPAGGVRSAASRRVRASRSSSSEGANAFLDYESNPGELLWRFWQEAKTGLPGELVGPVPETAYFAPRSGSPRLHEEGEPIFLGPPSEAFARSGGYEVSTEGLGPMDPLPSMIPLSLDEEPEGDRTGAYATSFSGPGSSSLGVEVHLQILEESLARVSRGPPSLPTPVHRHAARSAPPRVHRPLNAPDSERPGPHPVPSRSAGRVLGEFLPGSQASQSTASRATGRASAGEPRTADGRSVVDRPMTLGDLVARSFAESARLRSLAAASLSPVVPPRSGRPAHLAKAGVRCADCRKTVAALKGSRRCAACLRRICPECAASAPRSHAGVWCTRCGAAREMDAFLSEVDRRAPPGGDWSMVPEPDPDFGVLMG